MTSLLQGAVALLALLLPFEARRPLFILPGLMSVTGLEFLSLAILGCWILFRRERPSSVPPALAVLMGGLAFFTLASAAFAPAFRGASLKFALRTLTGLGAFFVVCSVCARSLPSRPHFVPRVLRLIVVGAALSSAVGIWTCVDPTGSSGIVPWFREREFLIGNAVRLSGTFEYPNIAAGFLASAFVLSLHRTSWRLDGRTLRSRAAWWGIQGILFAGLVMTLSRAGLAVAVGGLAAVAGLFWTRGGLKQSWRVAGPACVVCILCLTGAWLFYPPFVPRFGTEGDASWYRARYEPLEPIRLSVGEEVRVPVRVTNEGRMSWVPTGDRPFRLSYHWQEARTNRPVPALQARTELPHPVGPGESATLNARVMAPGTAGDFVLAWDMVHEHAAWFSQKGSPPGLVPCRVTPSARVSPPPAFGFEPPPDPRGFEAEAVSRRVLWLAGWHVLKSHPVLGVGPDNFRRLWGREYGMARWDDRVHANNTVVEMFATTGCLGGGAFLGTVGLLIGIQARNLRLSLRSGEEDARLAAQAALTAGTGAFLAHGLVDYFLAFTPMYLLFWMMAGLSVGSGQAR